MQTILIIDLWDVIVYFLAVFYALIVLIVGDLVRRKKNMSPDFTRKIIHLFAGFAIWSVPYYTHSWMATFVAFTFVVMLAMAGRERFSRFFEAMARPEDLEHGSIHGPFWYAVSITILTGLFTFAGYEQWYFAAAAGIHIMMLGDGMSAPIGMKYGSNHTRVILGSIRSLHGSLALFAFGFLGTQLAFLFFGVVNYGLFIIGAQIQWIAMIVIGFIGALAGTLIELVSPKGMDNITVPFLSTLVIFVLAIMFGIVVI